MMNKHRISDYDHSDYSAYWTERQRRYDNLIEREVINELIPSDGNWFVDLGCAHGRLTDIYINRQYRPVKI